MLSYQYDLYDGRRRPPLQLYAMQGEAGARTFKITLLTTQGPSPVLTDATVYAYVLKEDHTVVVIDCTASGNSVTFTLPLQACTCPGVNKMAIQVISGQTELRWDNLILYVEPCDLENAVASTDDLGPLANIITDPEYLEQIENAYTTATTQLESLMDAFTPMGEYSPGTTYHKFNVVTSGGSSYVALQATTGNAPPNPAYWQLMAAKGEQGSQGQQGPPGAQGNPGEPGQAATIQMGSVTTGAAGSQASVTNSGTSSAAVFDFVIPQGATGADGPQGVQGPPGTGLEIAGGPYATPEDVPNPEDGACYLVGTTAPYDVYYRKNGQWTNLGPIQGAQGDPGPQGIPGQAATIQVGQVTTGEPGSQAQVTNSGTENAAVLNFTIPQGASGTKGDTGATPAFSVGDVTTLEPDQPATATITGTAESPVLNLGIPQGQTGAPGQGGLTAEQVIALIYPVGAIMPSTVNVNPGTYLTGTTWELFGAGKTLVGVDTADSDFGEVEKTGGAKTATGGNHTHSTNGHVLTLSEIPSHSHQMAHSHNNNIEVSYTDSYHTHTFSATTGSDGPSGQFRVLCWNNASDYVSGDFSIGNNPYDRGTPASGDVWGAQTFTLSGNHTHTVSGTTPSGGQHAHEVSGGVLDYTGNTSTAGSGTSHSHGDTASSAVTTSTVQPYITCYFWKRTA